MQACLAKAGITVGGAQGGAPPDAAGGAQGGLGGGGRQAAAAATGARSPSACPSACSASARTITTPEQTLQQVVNPPQTNIKSSSYTIAGVDLKTPGIGVVTSALVSNGRFIDASEGGGSHEALLSASYASRQGLKVGSKLDLNGTVFTVVGLVRPPLGGRDRRRLRLAVPELQVLASQKGSVNVLLVRAEDGASVGEVREGDRDALPEGAGRERAAGRRLDQRLARRRRRPVEAARDRAGRARGGRSVLARGAAHALLGREARP